MPFFRFLIHGIDPRVVDRERGFYTTRHAFAATEALAADKVKARLFAEFTTGVSSGFWCSDAPILEVEEAWRIGLHQLLAAPNKGSTFYDERG